MKRIDKRYPIQFSYRVTTAIIGILIVIVFIQTLFSIQRERSTLLTQVNREKITIASMVNSSVSSGEVIQTSALKREVVAAVVHEKDVYFCRIVRSSGEIFITNLEEERGKYIENTNLLNLSEPAVIKQNYNDEVINVVITPPSSRGYVIMLGFSLNSIDDVITRMIFSNWLVSLLIIIIAAIFSFFISSRMVLPVLEFTRGADIISRGDLDFRIQVKSQDEIGKLSTSFNNMTATLQQTTVSKDFMNNILNNMVETVIVLDKHLHITMVNQATYDLLGYAENTLIGISAKNIFSPRSLLNCKQPDTLVESGKACKKESLKNYETSLCTNSGIEIPVLMSVSVMRLKSGEIQNILCVARDITQQKEVQTKLNQIQNKLLETAHKAGMAEIASGILHNIGNIATSINISMEKLIEMVKNSKVPNIITASSMLKEHEADLLKYLQESEKGKMLPLYFANIGEWLNKEYNTLNREIKNMDEKITMVKNVIDTQQEYAYSNLFYEDLYLIYVLEDALKIESNTLYKHEIEVVKDFPHPESVIIHVQKSKLIDIFINLFRNACEALKYNNGKRILSISVKALGQTVRVEVADNGAGIAEENINKIFNFGFTTRTDGFGFGLHSSAIFMNDMKGEIKVTSAGPGKGAVFTLIFPHK